mgnify:CR=1 FL=1
MNKTIGLIGGMTPESTIMYYRALNKFAAERFGEKHSSNVLLASVDFGLVSKYQQKNRWDLLNQMMVKAAKNLEKGGAKCILICANTMHLTFDAVRNNVTIPVLHIAETTGIEVKTKHISKVALLGTKYTMEKTFYKDVLAKHGIETLIPDKHDRELIHNVIYNELAFGNVVIESKQSYLRIINQLIENGAEGIVLGCTEIPMLINQADVSVPVFDTTNIHANAAFQKMAE